MCAFKNTLVLLMVCFISCNKEKKTIVIEQQNQIDLSVAKTTKNKTVKAIGKDTIGVVHAKEMAFNEKQFFGNLNKKYQVFKKSIDEEIIVLGKEGTKVSIPKNSLSYINLEKPIEREVTIYLNEYYQKGDMLLGNLTTETKDGLLESAGMINIEVYANGNRCQLKKGESIKVELPTKNKEEGFELFLGEYDQNNKMVWELDKKDEEQVSEPIDFEVPPRLSKSRRGYYIKGEDLKYDLKMYHDDTLYSKTKTLTRNFFERELLYYLSETFDNSNEDSFKARVKFKLSNNKEIDSLVVLTKNEYYKGLLEDYFKIIYTEKMIFTRNEYNMILQFTLKNRYRTKEYKAQLLKDSLLKDRVKRKFEKSVTKNGIQSKSAEEISNYVLNSTSLGWINCDRFYRFRGPKDDLIVQENGSGNYNIKLVFSDINTVMQGINKEGYVVFKNLPRGKKGKLISVKNIDSHTYWSSRNITISQREITDLAYKKVALEDLKKEIKRLNKS